MRQPTDRKEDKETKRTFFKGLTRLWASWGEDLKPATREVGNEEIEGPPDDLTLMKGGAHSRELDNGEAAGLQSTHASPQPGENEKRKARVAKQLKTPPGPGIRLEPIGLPTTIAERPTEEDLLDRKELVSALAALFQSKDQETPLTIGLFGSWGIGKSSILAMLKKRLRKESPGQFDFAIFNAWEYEHTANLAAGLAQEVVGGLVEGLGWTQKTWLRIRFGAREHKWKVLKALFDLLIVAVSLGAAVWLGMLGRDEKNPSGLLELGGVAIFLWFLGKTAQDLKLLWEHPLSTQLFTYLDLPRYGEHLGLIPVLKRHISLLCKLRLGKRKGVQRRLVVLIDDLDRCDAENIVSTFEAVRLVMDLSNVIVVIALDARVALKAISERYRKLEIDGEATAEDMAREYLGKIIQLPLRMQPSDNFGTYLTEGLFRDIPEMTGMNTPVPKIHAAKALVLSLIAAFRPLVAGTRAQQPDSGSREAMRESKAEKDLFAHLAKSYRFFNPRLLLRLRNSYRLLKLLNAGHKPKAIFDGTNEILKLLFFEEFMNQEESRRRAGDEYYKVFTEQQPMLEHVEAKDQEILKAIIPTREYYGQIGSFFDARTNFVRTVLLPACLESGANRKAGAAGKDVP